MAAAGGNGIGEQIAQLEQRLRDLRVELGEKAADLPAWRERLTKIEGRVLETSKEQIARAGESTGLRDRLARLEARLSDLSREQVARAVEAAGLRERVFRLEQRHGVGVDGARARRGGRTHRVSVSWTSSRFRSCRTTTRT